MFRLRSPSKHSPFDEYAYLDVFPTAQVFELVNVDAFQCFFLFHLFHTGKALPFEDFSYPGKQKSYSRQDQVNREGGA